MFKLKKIELLGFKSFADRTRLEFGDGTVGIVGPNGCGKSNIADAISWVLGEQSARSLRGERMADVIFNGTGKRPPTGMAEANITLIDPEYAAADAGVSASPLLVSGAQASSIPRAATEGAPVESDAEELPAQNNSQAEAVSHPQPLRHRAGEITVTRRLFRSGESEYLMNGEACRLRDIQDLFMGTGLGPESYAIIEQGRIGQILSSKPSDRRAIIEEAAGVSKFKTRKRLAEAKLESSRANLARITDILLEVTKQMNSLKRQAGKARRYREMSEELRGRLKLVLTSRLIALEHECARLHEQLTLVQTECSGAAQQLEALEREEKSARLCSDQVESGLTQLRQSAAQRDLERERLIARIDQIREQTAALEKRSSEAEEDSTRLRLELVQLEEETGAHARQCEQVRQEWESAKCQASRLLALQQRLASEFSTQEKQLEAHRQELLVTVSRAADLRNQLTKAEESGLALERQLARLSSERLSAEQEEQRHKTQFEASGLDQEREAGALTRLGHSVAESGQALKEIREEASGWQAKLEQLRHELSAATARKQALEESLARHAYSTETVRRLLSEPIPVNGHDFHPLGVLADFVEVSTGYEEVVEEFLKEALDYIVVEKHDEARSGIALLKDEGAGRTTFFVTRLLSNGHGNGHSQAVPADGALSKAFEAWPRNGQGTACEDASGHTPAPEVNSFVGALGNGGSGNGDSVNGSGLGVSTAANSGDIAAAADVLIPLKDLVRFVPRLGLNGDPALLALADTYLVNDAVTAERLAAIYPKSHFLTRSGEHYHHRLVSGGRGSSAGPLALRRDFREIEGHTLVLAEQIEDAENNSAEVAARVVALEESVRGLTAAKVEAEKKAVVADEKLRQLRETVDRAAQHREVLLREIVGLEGERQEIEACQSVLRARIQEAACEQTDGEEKISRLADLGRELRAQLDQAGRDLVDEQARSSALGERTRSAEAEQARLLAYGEEGHRKLERLAEQHAAWTADQQRLIKESQQTQVRLGEIEAEQKAAREELSGLEQQSVALRARLSEITPLIEGARAALEGLREKRTGAEVALVRAESDLTHSARQCREELKMDPATLVAELTPQQALGGEALEGAEQGLAELKMRIENLGPVNMMALEELQEAQERYSFLETQRQDLFASIEDTTQAIREIDQVSRQQFLEAFAAINIYFAESFRTLFGGGNGELRLTDDSDAESGVEMAAQPPGKRLQNVLLLSGGEKALAALALLIALFRYTPSPFCILDEVDAPLDETNVDRFTRLIREMSRHTQFILITHNKRTMEIAQALYGVTMEEPGVSKLVSVRF